MGLLKTVKHRVKNTPEVIEFSEKIDPKKVKRVVAYGCSFTAGDEIVDHIILNTTFEEVNKLKKKFSNQVEFYKHHKIIFPTELMLQSSWAGQLAKLLNVPIVNKAYPGTAISKSFFQIYNDFKTGFIKNDDLVLLGLTGPNRITFYNHDTHELDSSPLSYYIDNQTGQPNRYSKILLDLFDDNLNALNYYSFLQNIINLKSYINIKLQPMSEVNTFNSTRWCMTNGLDPEIYEFCKNVSEEGDTISLLPKDYLKRWDQNDNLCGYLHPAIENHINLAQNIYDNCVLKHG